MHEFSLMKSLIDTLSSIAREEHASKIISLTVKLGALSHISPDHFREHFIHASRGTVAEGARLTIEVMTDTTHPQSQDVLLENIEIMNS